MGLLLFTNVLFAAVHAFCVNAIKTNMCQDKVNLQVQDQHQLEKTENAKHAQGNNNLLPVTRAKNPNFVMILDKNTPLSNLPDPSAAEEKYSIIKNEKNLKFWSLLKVENAWLLVVKKRICCLFEN